MRQAMASTEGMGPREAAGGAVFTVPTRSGPVECAVLGEGPAVLALHGAMGGYDQALLLARAAGCPGFRFVAISRPGYLGTPLAAGRTPEEQADLYAEVLEALGEPDAAVVAISGGGPSALAFALRHAASCRGLVMISAASGRVDTEIPFAWQVMKLAARVPPLLRAMRRGLERDPDRAARRSIPDAAERARTLRDPEAGPLMKALQASTFERMKERIAGTENDIRTTRAELGLRLESLSVPVLVVHGTADQMAPFALGAALAARAPGAELLAIEGGEHVALFTHLREIRTRVERFLRACAPAGARSAAKG